MSVDPTLQAIEVRQHQQRLVFAGNMRIAAARLGVHRGKVSEQEPGGVDVMDHGFLDQEPSQVAEVGLARIGRVAQSVAMASPEAVTNGRPNLSAADQIAYYAVPGLPAPVLVNH